MLEIKMMNGDVLIHGDQQPDAMTFEGYDGSRVLVHAGEWGHHKYIRKEGNRYIYPEDLQKKAKMGYEVIKKGQEVAKSIGEFAGRQAERAKYATKDAIRKGSESTKNVYNDRNIYADAAKNMASDYKKAAKEKWDNGGKEAAKNVVKFLTGNKFRPLYAASEALSGKGSKKNEETVERTQLPAQYKKKKKKSSLKFGNVSQVTKPSKKSDSVDRSMPASEEPKKRPISHKKNIIEGGMEVKRRGNAIDTKDGLGVSERTFMKQPPGWWESYSTHESRKKASNEAKDAALERKKRAKKEEDQIRSAHQGDVYGQHKSTSNLELQKEKTQLRKIEKAERPNQAARQAEKERKNKEQEIRNEVGVKPHSINQIKIDTLRRKEHGAQYAKEKRAADQAELERRRRALGWY